MWKSTLLCVHSLRSTQANFVYSPLTIWAKLNDLAVRIVQWRGWEFQTIQTVDWLAKDFEVNILQKFKRNPNKKI